MNRENVLYVGIRDPYNFKQFYAITSFAEKNLIEKIDLEETNEDQTVLLTENMN